jgi:acyl-CoA synthetase (AMP-forming)/AMP-acid ligase II
MPTIAVHAAKDPDRIALIYGNGERRQSFGELEQRSRRIGHLLRRRGLAQGGCVAALIDNADPAFMEVYWACHRVGLYFTPVNWHLQEGEIQYIVDNCDADALFVSARYAELAERVAARCPKLRLRVVTGGGEAEGFEPLESALADVREDAPLENEREGSLMLYSSGTTGRPKGVRRDLLDMPAGAPLMELVSKGFLGLFGIGPDDRYLCPAPLYHAAPIVFSNHHLRIGASVVILSRFDPEQVLKTIQDQRVTSSQWVPTHFKRLLQLPESVRKSYDVSSLRVAVHAAAPCPIPVKRAMIDWLGDAVVEYYGGTEGGGTLIRAKEWLEHPGSVGRHWTQGMIHILDEEGRDVTQPGVEGAVYFEAPGNGRFAYYKDADKTASSYRGNLFTIGDIGYVDADGFLFLTDRQSNMIISGGVNIYPQETENHLVSHPKVDDVAVIGVPDEEMGEQVKAVVIPARGVTPGAELERELIEYCRSGIAHYKCPRSIDFVSELPRTETGKMAKRKLRARYWEGRESRLV